MMNLFVGVMIDNFKRVKNHKGLVFITKEQVWRLSAGDPPREFEYYKIEILQYNPKTKNG